MLEFSYLIIMNIKVFQEEFSTADKIIMHLVKNRSIMEEAISDLFICQCYNTEHQLIFSYFPEERC